MPLSITCGGTGAWISVSHWANPFPPYVLFSGEHARCVIPLLADIFSDALKLAAANASSGVRLLIGHGAREMRR